MAFYDDTVLSDLTFIANNLTKGDILELEVSGWEDYSKAIAACYAQSNICKTIFTYPEEEICGIFGVSPTAIPEYGRVWMLTTNNIHSISKEFIRKCRGVVDELFKEGNYSLLFNNTYSGNEHHLKLIKYCGFRITKEFTNMEGKLFYEFLKEA